MFSVFLIFFGLRGLLGCCEVVRAFLTGLLLLPFVMYRAVTAWAVRLLGRSGDVVGDLGRSRFVRQPSSLASCLCLHLRLRMHV